MVMILWLLPLEWERHIGIGIVKPHGVYGAGSCASTPNIVTEQGAEIRQGPVQFS